MKKLILFSFLLFPSPLFSQNKIPLHAYPTSRKEEISDNYFGTKVNDPYRWLEDDHSAETANWVLEQNGNTEDYIRRIPFRGQVKTEMTRMWNYTKYTTPTKEGRYYLFYKNDGLQNQSVLYIQKGINGNPEILINPNTLNDQGTSSLGTVELSRSQKYVAYSVSKAGSDWQDIYVMEIETRKVLPDVISYSKFSSITWKGDEGFYYSGYDKPLNSDHTLSDKTENQKIFYHKIGSSANGNTIVYQDPSHPLRYKSAWLARNQKWMILNVSEGTSGNELLFANLDGKKDKIAFKTLSAGFEFNQDIVDIVKDKFLVYTNQENPNYSVKLLDTNGNWEDFIPATDHKLDAVSCIGDRIFCTYLVNAVSKVDVYNLSGKFIQTLKMDELGTVSGFGGNLLGGDLLENNTFYSVTTFNHPPSFYKYDLTKDVSSPYTIIDKQPNLGNTTQKTKATVVDQQWFTSKDGTRVPMFIYHRSDVDLTKGDLPVFMYGYGGFNISLTPTYSIPISYFVQKGGVYVLVNLRGGSEFGEDWHKGGMLENKQNVFDDFIGAAEYLIAQGITTKDRIAIHGRSNGGLLVGACMTQRPDLFKVALPGVGVLDMLRYHKFTVGWGWAVEYGSSDKAEDFKYLYKYSPLHNIDRGMKSPATLITTADHDDRVVPAHSFKFAATLQEKNMNDNPILIRIDTQAGHGTGKSTTKQIDEWSDVMSFVMYHLGMDVNN